MYQTWECHSLSPWLAPITMTAIPLRRKHASRKAVEGHCPPGNCSGLSRGSAETAGQIVMQPVPCIMRVADSNLNELDLDRPLDYWLSNPSPNVQLQTRDTCSVGEDTSVAKWNTWVGCFLDSTHGHASSRHALLVRSVPKCVKGIPEAHAWALGLPLSPVPLLTQSITITGHSTESTELGRSPARLSIKIYGCRDAIPRSSCLISSPSHNRPSPGS